MTNITNVEVLEALAHAKQTTRSGKATVGLVSIFLHRMTAQEVSAINAVLQALADNGYVDKATYPEAQSPNNFNINDKGEFYLSQLKCVQPIEYIIVHWRGKKPPVPDAVQQDDDSYTIQISDLNAFILKHGPVQIYAPGQRTKDRWVMFVTDKGFWQM